MLTNDFDFLSGICEFVASYGVDPTQLALVIASMAALAGVKVSYRLGCMAARGTATQVMTFVRWAFAPTPASPAFEAAMTALEGDDGAVYDAVQRVLLVTGLMASWDKDGDLDDVLASPQKAGNAWIGAGLSSLLNDREFRLLCKRAEAKRVEVIERDRQWANVAAAAAISFKTGK